MRPRPRRRWVVPVVIAVVAGLVVAGLATTGQLPGFGSSGSKGPTGPDLTYAQAAPIASHAASAYATPAHLAVAIGIVSPVAYTAPIANLTGGVCVPTGGLAAELTIPSFSGNYSSGASPAWFFLYWQASPPDIVVVGVINGTAEYLGLIGAGPSCGAAAISQLEVHGTVIDSPRAASAAATYAGPFLAAHGSALAMYFLFGGSYGTFFTTGGEWSVGYSTCSLGVASIGSGFNASVNATSARVLSHLSSPSMSCLATPSILVNAGITGYAGFVADAMAPSVRTA